MKVKEDERTKVEQTDNSTSLVLSRWIKIHAVSYADTVVFLFTLDVYLMRERRLLAHLCVVSRATVVLLLLTCNSL